MKKAISILVGTGGAAAIIIVAAVTLMPPRAGATPAYAQQTGRPCGACHVNKAGGGKLTAAGAAFAKKHR